MPLNVFLLIIVIDSHERKKSKLLLSYLMSGNDIFTDELKLSIFKYKSNIFNMLFIFLSVCLSMDMPRETLKFNKGY